MLAILLSLNEIESLKKLKSENYYLSNVLEKIIFDKETELETKVLSNLENHIQNIKSYRIDIIILNSSEELILNNINLLIGRFEYELKLYLNLNIIPNANIYKLLDTISMATIDSNKLMSGIFKKLLDDYINIIKKLPNRSEYCINMSKNLKNEYLQKFLIG